MILSPDLPTYIQRYVLFPGAICLRHCGRAKSPHTQFENAYCKPILYFSSQTIHLPAEGVGQAGKHQHQEWLITQP